MRMNTLTDGKIRRLSHDSGVAVVSSVREAEAFFRGIFTSRKSF